MSTTFLSGILPLGSIRFRRGMRRLVYALVTSAIICSLLGGCTQDPGSQRRQLGYAAAAAAALASPTGQAQATRTLGAATAALGNYAGARRVYEQALAIDVAARDEAGQVLDLNNLGEVAEILGDYTPAQTYYEQALALASKRSDRLSQATALRGLGTVALRADDYTAAKNYVEQALAIDSSLGNRLGQAQDVDNLGNVAASQNNFAAAQEYYDQALAIYDAISDPRGQALVLANRGSAAFLAGDFEQAKTWLERSANLHATLGVPAPGYVDRTLRYLALMADVDFAPSPEEAASPDAPSPATIMAAARAALAAQGSYRFDAQMLARTEPRKSAPVEAFDARFTGVVQMPEHVNGHLVVTLRNEETVESDTIFVGQRIYVDNPVTGGWLSFEEPGTLIDPRSLLALVPGDFQELRLAGESGVDGTRTYHLTGQVPQPLFFGAPVGTVDSNLYLQLWVSREDSLPVRAAFTSTVELTSEPGKPWVVYGIVNLSDFGAPVAIEDPSLAAAPGVTGTLLAPLVDDTPDGNLARGLAALADGRAGLAITHLDRALAQRPDWADALVARSVSQAMNDLDAAMRDADHVIDMNPDRADAYVVRAWIYLTMILSHNDLLEPALKQASADVAQALALKPDMGDALAMLAQIRLWEGLGKFDGDLAAGLEAVDKAMADLAALQRQNPGIAGDMYLAWLPLLLNVKTADDAWWQEEAAAAEAILAEDPTSYTAMARHATAQLVLLSQQGATRETALQVEQELLHSLKLGHARMLELANTAQGPLQALRMWELQEALYSTGSLYQQAFFAQAPATFTEFGQMLANYWELVDLFAEMVDDPIIFGVAVDPAGSRIATLSESGPSYLRIWDAAGGELLQEVPLDVGRFVMATTDGALAFSPDGRQIVVAYTNPAVQVIDIATGDLVHMLHHEKAARSAAFSPDGTRILTVDSETDLPILWDSATGEKISTIEEGGPVNSVVFSPDGRLIVGGGEQVSIWDAVTAELVKTLPGYDSGYVYAPAVSPSGRQIAVPGNPVRVFNLASAEEQFVLDDLRGAIRAVVFSPDGNRIAGASFDGAVGVWDSATSELLFAVGHGEGADAVAFSPDGKLLISGGADGKFRVWDAVTGAELWNRTAVTLGLENGNPDKNGGSGTAPAEIEDVQASPDANSTSFPDAEPKVPRVPEELVVDMACVGCHNVDELQTEQTKGPIAPHLGNLRERAGTRVAGADASRYVHSSIVNPTAYIAPGYQQIMPQNISLGMSEDEIAALIEWLLDPSRTVPTP